MSFIFNCTLNFDNIFVDNVIAVKESPPSSIKVLLIPTLSTCYIFSIIFINSLSIAFLGFTISSSFSSITGSGYAFLSTFPFGVCGNWSIFTKYCGTIYSGNFEYKTDFKTDFITCPLST